MAEVFSWRDAPRGDYAVIGDPIAHSKSPTMHHAAYRALGLDLTYRAIHVPAGEVPDALEHLRDLGYRGVNVTVPHKGEALTWTSKSDELARESGGANTLFLRQRRATNTDGYGFRHSLRAIAPNPRRVLLLGAGGTASTVLLAMMERTELTIWNRNAERAHRLLTQTGIRLEPRSQDLVTLRRQNFGESWPATSEEEITRRRAALHRVTVVETPDLAGFDLIVNATPASLTGDDLALDWSVAKVTATAYDLAYGVDSAPFLCKAREAGLQTLDGRSMLAAQGAQAFFEWNILRLDPASVALGRTGRLPKSAASLTDFDTLIGIMRGALH